MKTPRRPSTTAMPVLPKDETYKGYWVHRSPFSYELYIAKDGCHIAYAASIDEAHATIDSIVYQRNTP